ncbi:MAG TPA: hypothetical protein VEG30_05080 [Terriglobales bacterium]|nr:hypothetical protein [Terriglobales bacterium]
MLTNTADLISQASRKPLRTRRHVKWLSTFAILVLVLVPVAGRGQAFRDATATPTATATLWKDPGDIRARDLYYGVGGKEDEPRGAMTFLKEDMGGTQPKFDARDEAGRKWKAKLGVEAQPETVATRLLWAVGYFANENYYLKVVEVNGLPKHLHRGQNFATSDGTVKGARLQRHPKDYKKAGDWSWKHNPFRGQREFNGLRVMMALIDNWDLTHKNNAVFEDRDSGEVMYEVSDVGASFGPPGQSYTNKKSKNNLDAYGRKKFISKITPKYVDFNFPTHPPLLYFFDLPLFFGGVSHHWIGKHIPRQDAKWVGSLLAQLSHEQICNAFRAAGYTPEQVEAYSAAVQARIDSLNRL